ncbi:MAG: alpha/beta fold hydrolase [Bacteroidia bacterium]|nr:alpha/beta fold hydrolase [Bacteroidia bacterium]
MFGRKRISLYILIVVSLTACIFPEKEIVRETGFLTLNGTELFYETMGEGEPLVILHGGPGMEHGYFLPHLETLAKEYKLIFFDQRACGRSSAQVDSSTMTMAQFVEDIDAVRIYFGIEKMNLMGHSWGGLLAMWYAKTYPDRLKSLILVNSIGASREFTAQAFATMNSRISDRDKIHREKIMGSESFQKGDSATILELYRFSFAQSFYRRELLDSLHLRIGSDALERQQLLTGLYSDLTNYDLHESLRAVWCPVLILHGGYDATPAEALQKVATHLPNARMVALPQCGHWAFIEAPDMFFREVSGFLKE